MENHTPTPWVVNDNSGMALVILGVSRRNQRREVAVVQYHNGSDDSEVRPNAAFIVKAVNNHDALIEALEVVLDDLIYSEHSRVIVLGRAALKAVKGAVP